jgi:chromosome segregation protein
MYFKRLEIVGFKSFFSKTILNFEPGITAVVGPNGCGKSNIFDSIRWVLGEQSVKSLRGSDMQDVIFNGTDSKEPLGMAEVTMTFDNKQRFFNVDHHEVAITRRIFRSGESEYLLNKTQVRLKDILDMLMGTGVGAESYSLVAQGKIDLILSSRPEDRRMVFDEASGITKYKTQKKEALRRLEETEQNLLRVTDIVAEVKRQIGSLERQANKARRYKEVFEELKAKEIKSAFLQKDDLQRQREILVNQLTELESREISLIKTIQDQEIKISNRQQELKAFEEELMAARNELMNLENLILRGNERISFNREKIAELQEQKKYLEAQIEQTVKRLLLDEDKLAEVRKEYDGIKKNIEDKSALLAQKEEALERIASLNKASLERISQAKKLILNLVSGIANNKNEIADLNSKEQIYLARKKRLEIEKAKVAEEKSSTQVSLDSVNQEVDSFLKAFCDIKLKIELLKNESLLELEQSNELKLQIAGLEKDKLTLESQKEFLDKLKTKYEDISESMNAVIYLDKVPAGEMSGLVIKVRDRVDLNDEDKAYFDPASFKISGEAKPIDLDTTKIGEQIGVIEQKIQELKNSLLIKEERIAALNSLIQEKADDARSQEMVLVNKKAQQQTTLEQFNKIKEEEDIIALELDDLHNDFTALSNRSQEAKVSLEALEKENKEQEGLILAEQNNISSNAGLKEETLMMITRTRTELESLNKRIISDEATLKIVEDTYRQDKENLESQESQARESLVKEEALSLEINELLKNIEEAGLGLKEKESLLKETEAKYKEASNIGSDVVKQIELDRKELDAIKNKLYGLQIQNKDLDFKYLSIKERMQQNYKVDLDISQIAETEVKADAEEEDINLLAQKIQELKEKIDSYGTVNLVAIEEYDELRQRYDFLNQQQGDLVAAKESLHEAILKINRTTKKMFLETFEKVCIEFRNYFRLLFNGGDAQVFLIDEQDPLESGIEIICRPPGKKLQNVLLLSGGEKAMAAIALIFAIFKVKPSPFCILDEIDAALDEANVDRFGRMLQEFAANSQFIVITHNKKTITNADLMYGITMEESGVSKIVSVKFAQNKLPAESKSQVAEAESIS